MKEKLVEFYRRNKTAVWLALIGLLFAVLILTINFWRTLLIIILVGLGFIIGKGLDQGKTILQTFYDIYCKLFKGK